MEQRRVMRVSNLYNLKPFLLIRFAACCMFPPPYILIRPLIFLLFFYISWLKGILRKSRG
jgi:hypothetical protein